jgi:predicted Zn-dependent peptidase
VTTKALVVAWLAGTLLAAPVAGQAPVGREAAEALRYPPLTFEPPDPEVHEVSGVSVLFLEDRSVPLVTIFARFKGGYALFGRSRYAAGTALPSLLRYGGTTSEPPDSVDEALEFYALQTSFGGGGDAVFSSMNTLTEHLGTALGLWGRMLRSPRFDTAEVETWRVRELESVRRHADEPQRLAFSEFNRLLYRDHPVGWEMTEEDLEPADLDVEILHDLHRRVVCPGNLTLGVTGDVSWHEIEPLLEDFLRGWPACPGPLPPVQVPDILRQAGVFLIPRKIEQSVIVMAHPTEVHLGENQEYFASQMGNSIFGTGGFSSRLVSRVRTQEGYAYSASSLWTTPRRYDGIVGAVTSTRPENTVPALRLVLEVMESMKAAPPTPEEMGTALDQMVNGFVFNFENPSQIVSRRMVYLAEGLPRDWLEKYLEGITQVTPGSIQAVFREHVHPEAMTILVVGDPDRIGREELESLGPVTVLEIARP